MDPTTARQVCRLIAGIVVSDDDLSPDEDVFVNKMLTHFGIPLEERDVVFPIIYSVDAAEAMSAFPEALKREAFSLLVEAAAVDGTITAEERDYLEAVREVVGVSPETLASELDAALAKRGG